MINVAFSERFSPLVSQKIMKTQDYLCCSDEHHIYYPPSFPTNPTPLVLNARHAFLHYHLKGNSSSSEKEAKCCKNNKLCPTFTIRGKKNHSSGTPEPNICFLKYVSFLDASIQLLTFPS